MGGGGACEEKKVGGVEVRPSTGGQKPATVADAVAVAALDQVRNDAMAKIWEMTEKLKTKNLSLHGELVVERTAFACALMDNTSLQRDRENAVNEKKKAARLLAAKTNKKENIVVIEQLKKDVMPVTLKAAKEVDDLATLLEQAVWEVEEL